MKRRERSAPIWLFSFVDLAFLLLIAFTWLAPDRAKSPVELAELELPRIERITPSDAAATGAPVWQVRVHPLAGSDDPATARAPFDLVEPGVDTPHAIDAAELEAGLALLRDRGMARPLLAPHRDARSEDLLVAVSLLESAWQGDRGVAVQPLPAVASPAGSSADDRGAR